MRETRGTVVVNVELTEPMTELISEVKDDGTTLEEWVSEAAGFRLRLCIDEHLTEPAVVDVPERAAKWARLRAEDAQIQGEENPIFADYLFDHVDIRFGYPDEMLEEDEEEEP